MKLKSGKTVWMRTDEGTLINSPHGGAGGELGGGTTYGGGGDGGGIVGDGGIGGGSLGGLGGTSHRTSVKIGAETPTTGTPRSCVDSAGERLPRYACAPVEYAWVAKVMVAVTWTLAGERVSLMSSTETMARASARSCLNASFAESSKLLRSPEMVKAIVTVGRLSPPGPIGGGDGGGGGIPGGAGEGGGGL